MEQTSSAAGPVGLAARISARTVAALWQQRMTMLVGVVVLTGVASYVVFSSGMPGTGSRATSASASAGQAGDCADTTMNALVNKSPDTLQEAYQCMDPTFRQRVSEQQFSTQVSAATGANAVTKLSRVGSYQERDGAELVYYALESGNQSVGYIVYLAPSGKVLKIE